MKDIKNKYMDMVRQVPDEIKEEINLTFAISNKIDELMRERGLSKKQFADQIGPILSKTSSGNRNVNTRLFVAISFPHFWF